MQESPPVRSSDGLVIRALASSADYDAAVALQDEIWGADFSDRVPASILRVAQKIGGVSAGAFDETGRLIGFVFGLTGLRDGRLVHWSDMLAVRPEARGHRLGERLKAYQRDVVRSLGVETMYWTFDPLVARNAHFNLNRLGARIAEYRPNFYGANTGSVLHGALPTDRFVAEWPLAHDVPRPASRSANGLPGAITVLEDRDGRPQATTPFPDADRVRIAMPRDIEPLLQADPDTALAWRLAARAAITHYLDRGYHVTGFSRGDAATLPAYFLTSPSVPPA